MDLTQADRIRTVFKIHMDCEDPTAFVLALYGSHPCVGEWKVEDARIAQYIGLNDWQIVIPLPTDINLSYKLLLLEPVTRHVLQKEAFTRHRNTGYAPLHVALTFDEPSCCARVMKSSLTKSGNPIALPIPRQEVKLYE